MLGPHNLICCLAFLFAGFMSFPADWSIINMWIGAVGILAYYEQTKRSEINETSSTDD